MTSDSFIIMMYANDILISLAILLGGRACLLWKADIHKCKCKWWWRDVLSGLGNNISRDFKKISRKIKCLFILANKEYYNLLSNCIA